MNHAAWVLVSIWTIDLVALVSPGPNFLMVTQTAMRHRRRTALMVALGIACGSALWGTAVAIGLSALFRLVPWFHAAVALGGAAYLIYLGIGLWCTSEAPGATSRQIGRRSRGGAFARGLITNLLNPKSAAYYGSIFAVFLPAGTHAWLQASAIALITATAVAWYSAVAILFSTDRVRRRYAAARRTVNRVAGTVMAGFGARLLLFRN